MHAHNDKIDISCLNEELSMSCTLFRYDSSCVRDGLRLEGIYNINSSQSSRQVLIIRHGKSIEVASGCMVDRGCEIQSYLVLAFIFTVELKTGIVRTMSELFIKHIHDVNLASVHSHGPFEPI